MSDPEFDILDELYFVISFPDLVKKLDYEAQEVKEVLQRLAAQKYVKILRTPDDEIALEDSNFPDQAHEYYYLATKAGLMAHNMRS